LENKFSSGTYRPFLLEIHDLSDFLLCDEINASLKFYYLENNRGDALLFLDSKQNWVAVG
jgi:hypothetical protein